jgi:hypothetical protein
MAIPAPIPQPTVVGAVIIGDGITYFTRFLRSIDAARWLKSLWFARSAGAYSAVVVPVYSDGTTGGNAAAKTHLQTLTQERLIGPRVNSRRAKLLVT